MSSAYEIRPGKHAPKIVMRAKWVQDRCGDKRVFRSPAAARREMRRLGGSLVRQLSVYRCRHCNGYHYTSGG